MARRNEANGNKMDGDADKEILSKELLDSLGSDAIITHQRTNEADESKRRKQRHRGDHITYHAVARPDRSVESRKKGQRNASSILEAEKVSKRKRKHMEKLEAERMKKERRQKVYESLMSRKMSEAEQSLMKSSASLGSGEGSKREQLRDQLLRSRAGINVNETVTNVSGSEENGNFSTIPTSRIRERKDKIKAKNNKVKLFVPRKNSSSSSDMSDGESDIDNKQICSSEKDSNANKSFGSNIGVTTGSAMRQTQQTMESSTDNNLRLKKNEPIVKQTIEEETTESAEPKFVVRVNRPPEIQENRMKLPVTRMEQEIMETIQSSSVTVLCGETGSGKTTQVPQFLFEAGYGCTGSTDPLIRGCVGVTQPRRVATVGMAKRVAQELGTTLVNVNSPEDSDEFLGTVGYQIRYDSKSISDKNRLKFMTDGVLLREARDDILLRKYSLIILDEAHERNLNTDILLGLLSRIIPLRLQLYKEKKVGIYPLKLIIMSATLRVSDFTENHRLFPQRNTKDNGHLENKDSDDDEEEHKNNSIPVMKVEARQFPVTAHFSRRTELRNYLEAAFKKVCSIHRRLPPGGVLVFLTGQREIEWMCKALAKKYPIQNTKRIYTEEEIEDADYSDIDSDEEGPDVSEGSPVEDDLLSSDKKSFESEKKRIEEAEKSLDVSHEPAHGPMRVLPLYSRLASKKQLEIFKPVPDGERLVVVATNVAETSITIPGIKYVVDCGREKRKTHDQWTGISKFEVGWVSQASADQRKGRAGRTGPGHAYRLYSSAVFENYFPKFSDPEIMRMPIEDIVLYMKTMGINDVSNFPFPTAPESESIQAAVTRLTQIGALSSQNEGKITEMGRKIAKFPVRARLGKMLAIAIFDLNISFKQLARVIALVAAQSLQSPFLHLVAMEGQGIDDSSDNESEGSSDSDDDEDESEDESEGKSEDEGGKQKEKEEIRKRRERAKLIHQTWLEPDSDMLSILKAVGAYAHAEAFTSSGDNFCSEYQLHLKTMREISQLRWQLAKLSASIRSTLRKEKKTNIEIVDTIKETGYDEEFDDSAENVLQVSRELSGSLSPPTSEEKEYLRQLLASGLLDQVAKKMTKAEARAIMTKNGQDSRGKSFSSPKRWPYQVCNMNIDIPVYIHPHSYVYRKNPNELPEYVVYGEICTVARGKDAGDVTAGNPSGNDTGLEDESAQRPSISDIRQVTAVDPAWLPDLAKGTPQCTLSAPLEQPMPRFSKEKDCVQCLTHPLYGPRKWRLPMQWTPYPHDEGSVNSFSKRGAWFARLLLEGKVLEGFDFKHKYRHLLAIPPAYATRKPHDVRVVNLLKELYIVPCLSENTDRNVVDRTCHSSTALVSAWKSNKYFLRKSVTAWVQKEHRQEFKERIWEEIITSVLMQH